MISILFLWATILFATVSENNKKDIVFYSKQGGSSLLISGEAFKKAEPENWISYTAVPYIFEIVIFVLLFELALIVF